VTNRAPACKTQHREGGMPNLLLALSGAMTVAAFALLTALMLL
jgi:hypothetical protein